MINPDPKLLEIQRNYVAAIAAVHQIAESLGLTRNKDLTTILQAIADLKDKAGFNELRSERDYYRDILDKLCDRLNAPNIEALEHIAKYQEMDLDFTSQHNEDLRGKLVDSQALNLRHLNRIIELESEVRSIQEPLPESDRLSNAELIQLVRLLLNP